MKVFLTGGTGYLGEHVARALVRGGHAVSALVRGSGGGAALMDVGAEVVVGDLLEPSAWAGTLGRVEAVVHAAGLVEGWGPRPELFDRINVQATLDLVDRARSAGIERILVAGSLFALGPGDPRAPKDERSVAETAPPLLRANDYVRSKSQIARELWRRQMDGDPTMVLFPTILLGPGRLTAGNHTAQVLSDVGRGRFPGFIGAGEQVWDLVPVSRVAEGFRLALEKGRPGENYVLGGEHWTQRRLVQRAAELFGIDPPTRRLGTRLPMLVGAMAEVWASVTGRAPVLTRAAVRLYDADWVFTSAKAERELGYERGSLDEAVQETVRWLREEIWTGRKIP
jgi:nucleoside-diphosphate-sugar epimerase